MLATHISTIHARCPVDNRWDYYQVEVQTNQLLNVEEFERVLNQARGTTAYQESLAKWISAHLPPFTTVKLTGVHGQQTKTVVIV